MIIMLNFFYNKIKITISDINILFYIFYLYYVIFIIMYTYIVSNTLSWLIIYVGVPTTVCFDPLQNIMGFADVSFIIKN